MTHADNIERPWHSHLAVLNKVLLDGSKAKGVLMRRRNLDTGRFEYRLPTADEEADFVSADAW